MSVIARVAGTGMLLAVVAGAALIGGRWHWRNLTRDLLHRLEPVQSPARASAFDARELEGLPAPVKRYLRSAIAEGLLPVAAVSLTHEGSFNMGETTDNWRPFSSTQRVVTGRAGFVWDARVSLLPGLAVHVHDAYVAGEGLLHASIGGLHSVVDLRGAGDIAQGEFMRYVAEAPWYPTVLLPSQGARWDALDERSARVTLRDGERVQSLTFVFGDDGLVQAVRADVRGRTVGGSIIPTPWEGRWSDYAQHDGLRVPSRGEVAWLLPEGRKAYWRGTLTSIRHEFAPL